ncbi:MAG: AAA family ATPase [Campylobacterales bacterium]|nr:AAA family ATPase [Campylobacterales bacterium]
MDINTHLVLIEKKDRTENILTAQKTSTGVDIQFFGKSTVYSYGKQKVEVLQNPKSIDPASCLIYLQDKRLFNIQKILDFGSHIKVFYGDNKTGVYPRPLLRFERNALDDKGTSTVLAYLKRLAKAIASEENDFLDKQYEKMDFLSEASVLVKYLKQEPLRKYSLAKTPIFPFGLNLSQEAALTASLTHQASIIEGPPGTGKTQTILNIIANLVMNNKTVAVVSNNNAAIQNVYDKLEAQHLSFFAAMLGNRENQEAFFSNQQTNYPDLFALDEKIMTQHWKILEENIVHVRTMLQAWNDLCIQNQKREALHTEKQHFLEMYATKTLRINHDWLAKRDPKILLSLWGELECLLAKEKKITLFFKIKAMFKYRIFSFDLYAFSLDEIILFLQKCFYDSKERILKQAIEKLERLVQDKNHETLLRDYQTHSMALFKAYLSQKYDTSASRTRFEKEILWKDFKSFSHEYPVVLSTTHSLKNCTQKYFLYDYLIIDEASQVDVVAGSLALSCAKNVVIVGDLKQLPHVVTREIGDEAEKVFGVYSLSSQYHYKHSLLYSASNVFYEAPRTLLKEHYRCHPKIIDFCNKKFYDGALIILSKAKSEVSPLVFYNTAQGKHARGTYNQRQIDVIKEEILPSLHVESLGVVSPYRKQVNKMRSEIDQSLGIEIDTVHKYQGREQDVMIITTVVDDENAFADDPNLLNVAISRAKEKLFLVVSDNEKNKNMKDLVAYIKYNNFDIIESKVYSIFDLLYQSYAPYLARYLGKIKNVSEFKSENLMNHIIETVLSDVDYAHLDKVLHLPLNRLIRESDGLEDDEKKFAQNPLSHVDFLIYNKIHMQPVLVIEVDGVAFHEHNPTQLRRDTLKNTILRKCNISYIRFATNGSEEEKKLREELARVHA